MTNLRGRLDKLESFHGLNISKPIIVFRPEPYDHDQIGRQAEINQLKKSGRLIVILFWLRCKRWEPVVVEMLIDELKDRGHDVRVIDRNNRFSDLEHEFLAAEIDLELLIDGETVNGEMKTVHPFAAKDWGEQDTDEIPIYYTAQILHGQMVTRRNKTIVAALIGADDLRVHTVDRDDEMINVIRAKELELGACAESSSA